MNVKYRRLMMDRWKKNFLLYVAIMFLTSLLYAVAAFALLVVIGCDEGMQMVKPVVSDPTEESVKPTTNGEVKQPEQPADNTPAEVVELNYYLDENFTRPLANYDLVMLRETVYTKIVFSKAVPVVIGDDRSARPRIYHNDRVKREDGDYNVIKTQYRIKPSDADLQSGDAKLYRDTDHIFICKFMPQLRNVGDFFFTFVKNRKFLDVQLGFTYYLDREMPVDVETVTDWNPEDFTGVVYEPGFNSDPDRIVGLPAVGVTVTIRSGSRTGESTITDNNGRYIFSDVDGDELHLRAERTYLEPKEVIVHRSRDTFLPDGTVSNPFDDVQRKPGGIMLGHPWPDGVRFILEEVVVIPDLLLVRYHSPTYFKIAGFYSSRRVCAVSQTAHDSVIAHELVHAHQHALAVMHGGKSTREWEDTPEGRAYVEARNKDLKEFGKAPVDREPGYDGNVLHENAARICVYYWSIDRWPYGYSEAHQTQFDEKIVPKIPNRLKWAEEWLTKKYK